MTENKLRNSNIELLRLILMFFIFLWHILVNAYEIKLGPYSSVQASHIQLIMCSIFVPSVNCFMLISGYYGINFTKDKATSFILQGLFYSYGLLLFKILTTGIDENDLFGLAPISTYRWWFFTFYFMIMLLAPLINKGLESINLKDLKLIIIGMIIINSLGLYFTKVHNGYDFISLFIVYLIGRYLRIANIKINRHQSIIIWFTTTSILAFIAIYFYSNNYIYSFHVFSYNNILIIIQAVAILYFTLSFKKRSYKPFIYLGTHSFAIFLITGRTAGTLYKQAKIIIEDYNLIYGIIFVIFVMIVCIVIDSFQAKINLFIRKRILSKFLY